MTIRKLVVATIFPALLLSPVFAAAADRTGWGISGIVGASKMRGTDGADTFDGNAFGFATEFEYRFSPHFALGFGGFSLGEASDTVDMVDTTIKVKGLELFGRLIIPTSDTVDIFVRAGSAAYFPNVEPGYADFADSLFGEDALELGAGVDFGRRDKLAFRVEGRYFNGSKDESGALLAVGFNYLF